MKTQKPRKFHQNPWLCVPNLGRWLQRIAINSLRQYFTLYWTVFQKKEKEKMEQMSTCCKHSRSLHCFYPKLVGRAGWFGRLSDSFLVYIGPSPRKREKEENWQMREKCSNNFDPHLLQAQYALTLLFSKLVRSLGTGSSPSTIAPPDLPKDAPALKVTQCHRPARPTTLSKRTKVKWLLLGERLTLKASNNLSFLVNDCPRTYHQ